MADISITAASVLAAATARTEQGIFGATIAQGKVVYQDATSKKYLLADNDGSGTRSVRGIALNAGADGQPGTIAREGDVTIGGTLTPGVTYYLSGTAGGICPIADVTSGHDPIVIGVAKSASVLTINISDPDVTL